MCSLVLWVSFKVPFISTLSMWYIWESVKAKLGRPTDREMGWTSPRNCFRSARLRHESWCVLRPGPPMFEEEGPGMSSWWQLNPDSSSSSAPDSHPRRESRFPYKLAGWLLPSPARSTALKSEQYWTLVPTTGRQGASQRAEQLSSSPYKKESPVTFWMCSANSSSGKGVLETLHADYRLA